MASLKRKLANKIVVEKCSFKKALKDLEKVMSNKRVPEKYSVPMNTVSAWLKNKEKLLASLEKKGVNSKRQNLSSGDFKKVDKQFTLGLLVNKASK